MCATERRLAWDGLEFTVPVDWELARYHYPRRRQGRLVIEDDVSKRLDIEWIESPFPDRVRRFVNHAASWTEQVARKADRCEPIAGMPPHWQASRLLFSEILPVRRRKDLGVVRHGLVTAAYVPPGKGVCCLLRLHVLPEHPDRPDERIRHLAESFCFRPLPEVRWCVYDLDFTLSDEFELEATDFGIGAKLMVFRRDGRRLFCWTLSCADRIVPRGSDGIEWAVRYLNAQRRVPGLVFLSREDGSIGWRRRRFASLVQADELARRCLRYAAGCRHDPGRNQLVIWVFNYRHHRDLQWIRGYPLPTEALVTPSVGDTGAQESDE